MHEKDGYGHVNPCKIFCLLVEMCYSYLHCKKVILSNILIVCRLIATTIFYASFWSDNFLESLVLEMEGILSSCVVNCLEMFLF